MITIDINNDRSENVKYDYSDFPIYVRRAFLSYYPNYAAESHWHDDIELMLILSGKMLYNVNGEIITLNEGEGIWVNTRQLHFGYSDDKTECDFICILFHPILLCATKDFENRFVEPVLNSGVPYVHLSSEIEWKDIILNNIQNIYNCKDKPEATLCSYGELCSLWSKLFVHVKTDETQDHYTDTRLTALKKMIDYIYKSYNGRITLENVANKGNVSKRTCGNIFLKYLNKTPMEFITDYRLRKAIEFMKTTDMTILEISLEAGFSGASYFSETFRKNYGVSPTEYKKMFKETHNVCLSAEKQL